jgi:Flp pilus assembly protein TadG
MSGPVSGPAIAALKRLHHDRRGAVLVEFLVAFMPLMITFSSFVQVAQIATASIVTKHATIIGARAAAVISNEHNNTPDQKKGKNQDQVEAAIQSALGPWAKTMKNVKVEITDESTKDDPYGNVRVNVIADYKCSVPFGGFIVCGKNLLGAGTHQFRMNAAFPHQGACYQDLEGGGCDK